MSKVNNARGLGLPAKMIIEQVRSLLESLGFLMDLRAGFGREGAIRCAKRSITTLNLIFPWGNSTVVACASARTCGDKYIVISTYLLKKDDIGKGLFQADGALPNLVDALELSAPIVAVERVGSLIRGNRS